MIDILIEAPLPPRGKGRPRIGIVAGHAHAFTPSETRRWEALLASLAQAQLPTQVIEGPVRVDILALAGRPKSLCQRWKRPRPGGYGDGTYSQPLGLLWRPGKPDGDNVRKAVLDALKSFWRDDAQVVSGETLSGYAEVDGRARVVVRIRSEERECEAHARWLGLLQEVVG
ncbi:MAG: RusA family crossover junction endodeoxyribonuclease [Myxococcota bacterium]|jgi:Holliday junction resolvase RusA-like endonuclease|nr:RusA family crossover junction endodeoxyribonuclease [Myxococcota bacterium]